LFDGNIVAQIEDDPALLNANLSSVTYLTAQVVDGNGNPIAGHGSASVDTNTNEIVFDPGTDFDPLDPGDSEGVIIAITFEDANGTPFSSTFNLNVLGENDTPVAVADAADATENGATTIDVLANDTDIDGDDNPSTFSIVSATVQGGKGSVSIVNDQLVFDPGTDFDDLDPGDTATVTLDYTMSDDSGGQSSSTVEVTVNGANDGPTVAGPIEASRTWKAYQSVLDNPK